MKSRWRFTKVVRRMGDGAIVLDTGKHGRQIWTRRKLRKPTNCAATDAAMKTGEWAWSPITNGGNRGDRVSDNAMAKLIADNESHATH